jgi:hypothetical protein
LPDTKTNSGSDASVETLDTVLRVNIFGGLGDSEILWAVWIDGLRLHLDTDNLNRLVPGGETTTEGRGKDLLPHSEGLAVLLSGQLADLAFGETGQSEAGSPVGHLADGDCVDSLVDSGNTFLSVDFSKDCEGAWWLDTGGGDLVTGDLDGLHAGAESHGCVGLSYTTDNTSGDTGKEGLGAERAGIVFGFGGNEEENGSLSRGFNPGLDSSVSLTVPSCASVLFGSLVEESLLPMESVLGKLLRKELATA